MLTVQAGEEVTQQLYNFEDKGERRVSLRPEMTPSLARMVMARGKSLTLPVKWFSIPQVLSSLSVVNLPLTGRTSVLEVRADDAREASRALPGPTMSLRVLPTHSPLLQWNMDIWGVPGIEAEAELLSAIVTFFKKVGITSQDVGIKVNSRAVLSEVLTAMGVPADKFAATCVLVDKLEKVKLDDIRGEMQELGLTDEIITKLVATLSIKDLDALEQTLGNDSKALAQVTRVLGMMLCGVLTPLLAEAAHGVRGGLRVQRLAHLRRLCGPRTRILYCECRPAIPLLELGADGSAGGRVRRFRPQGRAPCDLWRRAIR